MFGGPYITHMGCIFELSTLLQTHHSNITYTLNPNPQTLNPILNSRPNGYLGIDTSEARAFGERSPVYTWRIEKAYKHMTN